jgi:hypothetical protein
VGEGDDDSVAAPDEREQVALGLGQPAGRERGPLGFECVRLTGRQLRQVDCAAQAGRRAELLLGRADDLVPFPDEIHARQRGDEIVGSRARIVTQPGLDEVEATFGSGVNDGGVERVERSLRERGEGA